VCNRRGAKRFCAPTRVAIGITLLSLSKIDSFAAVWFAAINVGTLLAFGYDKWQAGRLGKRVSELKLLLLGVLGGWLGGLLGMSVFRHKTAKGSFQFKYALALFPAAAGVWAWWHWR